MEKIKNVTVPLTESTVQRLKKESKADNAKDAVTAAIDAYLEGTS